MAKYKQSLFKTPTIKQVLLPGHLVANILTTVLPNLVPSPYHSVFLLQLFSKIVHSKLTPMFSFNWFSGTLSFYFLSEALKPLLEYNPILTRSLPYKL